MKKRGKIIFLSLIICILLGILGFVLLNNNNKSNNDLNEEYVKVDKNGIKVNTSNKIKDEKQVDGLIIKDIKIQTKNKETILVATVKNPTNEKKGDYSVTIKIKDEEGNIIKEIGGYINTTYAKEETTLRIKTSYDFANAYDLEIEKD